MNTREYFSDRELSCQCGCGAMHDVDSIERLYALRILWGGPIYVTSGARCPAHNKLIGGATKSYHLPMKEREAFGKVGPGTGAFDISEMTWIGVNKSQADLLQCAMKVGFRGFGIAKTFLHIDGRKTQSKKIWTYQ